MITNPRKMVQKRVEARLESIKDLEGEILEAIKNGDQYRNFLDGLTNKLIKAAALVARRGKIKKLSDSTINTTIDDFTDHFVQAFKHDQLLRNETESQRLAREQKIQDKKDLEKTLDGDVSGVYQELGVEIVDRTEDLEEEE